MSQVLAPEPPKICTYAECNREITSAITGELCTSHYFASKNPKPAPAMASSEPIQEDKPIMLGVKKTTDPDEPEHKPSLQKVTSAPNDGKKWCQSCIERYGTLNLAMREWTPGYFICDDCLEPLLRNQLDYADGRVQDAVNKVKSTAKINS